VKNYVQGLENAARGLSLSLYGPTVSRQITCLFFSSCSKLVLQITNGFVYATLGIELASKHSIEFTYSDFLCHFKVNRYKLGLTNRRWMCKKGKILTITANF